MDFSVDKFCLVEPNAESVFLINLKSTNFVLKIINYRRRGQNFSAIISIEQTSRVFPSAATEFSINLNLEAILFLPTKNLIQKKQKEKRGFNLSHSFKSLVWYAKKCVPSTFFYKA